MSFIIFASCLLVIPLWACTDILVTPEASNDGSAMIAYNADSGSLMGFLYHYPPTFGRGGQERQIYEWDTGVSSRA
jgi:Peptidase family C69